MRVDTLCFLFCFSNTTQPVEGRFNNWMSGGYLLNMEKKDKFKLNDLLQHLVIEEIKELMA